MPVKEFVLVGMKHHLEHVDAKKDHLRSMKSRQRGRQSRAMVRGVGAYMKRYPAAGVLLLVFLLISVAPSSESAGSATFDSGFLQSVITLCSQTEDDLRKARIDKGKFLVASRRLEDPNFEKTVVLITDHGVGGTIGLVINKPARVHLSELFPDLETLREKPERLYIGGPVAQARMTVLFRWPYQLEGAYHVFENVYMSSSRDVLMRILAEKDSKEVLFRVFAGYAGWAPGQLNAELAMGGWHVVEADPAQVFVEKPSGVWQSLMDELFGKWVDLHRSRRQPTPSVMRMLDSESSSMPLDSILEPPGLSCFSLI
jgi:putative transcriptional regulator